LDEVRQKLVDRGLYIYSSNRGAAGLPISFDGAATAKSADRIFLILNQQFNTLIKAGCRF